jgi:HAD superfamily hydrolase (TIGR01509 family)
MAIEFVIFDCDGVLVDSERVASRVLRDILNDHGGHVTDQEMISAFKGKTLPQLVPLAKQHFAVDLPDDFITRYHDRLYDAFRRELQPIPGIISLLDQLTLPCCVASNSGRERVELSLASTGLKPYFEDRIFTVDDVEHGKPAPDIYLLAAKTLNANPATTLVIEDSVTGVTAGIAAGMTVLGYADLTPADALEAAGATVITDMTAVLPYLQLL